MNGAEAQARDTGLTQSDIVLMFASDFAEPQDEGYEAPCSNAQVKLSSLVREMLMTAFLSLSDKGIIKLAPGKRKRLFSEHQTAFVASDGDVPASPAGFEGAVVRSVRPKAAENSVRDMVSRIVGSTTIEPYSAIVEMSMENAAVSGCFEEQARTGTAAFLGKKTLPKLFQPKCDRIATLAPRVAEVRRMSDAFRSEHPGLYEVLYEDIEQSVRAAYFRT